MAILKTNKWPERAILLRSQYGKGVQEVDDEFLSQSNLSRNEVGLIVVAGDGLFTQLKDQPLLNVSGDAHAIILKSPTAVAILVGSWHCIKKDIFSNVIDSFLKHGIQPQEITLHVGPGLGAGSYSIGEGTYLDFKQMYGQDEHSSSFAEAFTEKKDEQGNPKLSKKDGSKKYVVNFSKLMQLIARHFQIAEVLVDESKDTFGKASWKIAKAQATELGEQGKSDEAQVLLKSHYRQQHHFGARLFTRTERHMRQVGGEPGATTRDYLRTGRCLNGVMLQKEGDEENNATASSISNLTLT